MATQTEPAKPAKPAKTAKKPRKATKRHVPAWLRKNFDIIEDNSAWESCYVNFRGKFAGLGQARRVPRRDWIHTHDVRIPYVVMNRFETVVWPNRIPNFFKVVLDDQPLITIDYSRTIHVGSKTYACPPVHSQDNWSAKWKYHLEAGSCECTMLDGSKVHRLVVNIVDN